MSGKPSADAFNSADAANQFAIIQSYLISIYPYLYAAGIKPEGYNHIIEMHGQRNTALLNKLNHIPGAYEFMNMTPDKMGQLVPQIRIYKQLYNKDGSPSREIEFAIPNRISTDILLSDTTDQGVGIKNFQYKYVGSNPATVRNDIEAKLTLYFQNFSELLRVRTAPSNESFSFLDLFSRANKKQQEEPASPLPLGPVLPQPPLVLTNPSTGNPTNDRAAYQNTVEARGYENLVNVVDPAPERDEYASPIEFEIKAVVGWAYPKGNTTLSFEEKEAIKNSNQAFFLTLIDHDFSFEQDGSFSVELNYRARLGAILDSPQLDILRLDTITDHTVETQTLLEDSGLVNIFEGSVSDIINTVNIDLRNARYNCNDELADELQSRLDRLESNLRGERYRKIANYLTNKKRFYAENIDSGMLNSWANARTVGTGGKVPAYEDEDVIFGEYRGGTYQDPDSVRESEIEATLNMLADQDPLTARETAYEASQTTHSISPLEAAGDALVSYFTAPEAQAELQVESDFREKRWEDVVNTARMTQMGSYSLPNADNKFIYFLFGDLLDYVVEESKKSSPAVKDGILQQDLEKIKILIGSCDLGLPSNPIYSITHIPISWEAFRNFWYKKVIKPKRDKYPLLQFIRDAIRDLIFGAINSVYYNSNTKRHTNTFKSAFVSLPQSADGYDPVVAASIRQGGGGIKLDFDEFNLANPLAVMNSTATSQDMYHYMCIFVEDGKKGQFSYQSMLDAGYKSRRAYNKERLNIHHFGFGEDRGVLKNANFSKTDQPYLRESRYLERGGDPLIQLSNVYEASISLFGAPFFYPGQYVWITPYGLSKSKNTAYRLGSPDAGPINGVGGSIANIMGLGGYHIIIDVEGIIEDGMYEVNINARYDNSGAKEGDREGYGSKKVNRCQDNAEPISNV